MSEADVSTDEASAATTAPEHEGTVRTSTDGGPNDKDAAARDGADGAGGSGAVSGARGAGDSGADEADGKGSRGADAARPTDAADADTRPAGTGAEGSGATEAGTRRAAAARGAGAGDTGATDAGIGAADAEPTGAEDEDDTDEPQGLTPRQARHVRIALSAAIMIAVGAVLVLRLGSTHSVLTLAFYGMALILSGSALMLSRAGRTRWATLVLGTGVAVAVVAEWAVASMR
ncbi:hypothetical protein AB0957_09535 [Streptomyces zhihengii]|uniref:hypothetical protein n=1 Tax=Streptomyces zhihengii TaxID=1818004 RepID=UPI00345650AB